MNFIRFIVIGLWTSFSVFTYTDLSTKIQNQSLPNEYQFEPDPGNPGVEVAPLDVNSEDEDVPIPNTTNFTEENDTTTLKKTKSIEAHQLEEE